MRKEWTTAGYEGFSRGRFGNAGQNLYVSAKGILQRIYQYDLNRDGYVDLVFANCQDHGESAPSYVYTMDGERMELPAQGAVSALCCDLSGNGYMDIVIAGQYDMAAPFASTDIYYGSAEGYGEKYHIRIPTPFAVDCAHGDLYGDGKPALAFAMPHYDTVRIFRQTELGFEWTAFREYAIPCDLLTACDLDGDGFDDLIVRRENDTETTVYWGSAEGIDLANATVLPPLDPADILAPEEEVGLSSEMETKFPTPRLLQSVVWNNQNCFTLSSGKKLFFYTAAPDRTLTCVHAVEVPLAMACSVGDLDGDGRPDIAVASKCRGADPKHQRSFIFMGDGRTIELDTQQACDVQIFENHVLFCQASVHHTYTNTGLLFTYPDFGKPRRFSSEDARRCAMFRNPDGREYVFLQNHFSRSSIGYDESFIYFGSAEGYSEENCLRVPCHCAVDALIADLDDDGYAELLIGNNSENSAHLDVGHHIHYFGEQGFEPARSRTIETKLGWGVITGDFNHDGYLEIITPANWWKNLRIFYGKEDFRRFEDIAFPENANLRWPTAVDVNGDGWLDLVVPSCGSDRSYILYGGPEGFSIERSQALAVIRGIGATAADLTKNGYPDLILGGHTETPRKGELTPHQPHHSYIHIYWNGPEGISETRKCLLRGDAADSFAIADFNGDGWLDIFSGSYHGGKDRDVNSFLYWNREGRFSESDRELLPTHSASGCMAADFNEDGYVDLAVANHKVFGDHAGYSTVWWNGERGFNPERVTNLPTFGPHGMISNNIGNGMDRSDSEYYYSEVYRITEETAIESVQWDAELPQKTKLSILFRVNGGDYRPAQELHLRPGDTLEYRLELYAKNGCRTPRVRSVTVLFG